jgi:hypothetical protein
MARILIALALVLGGCGADSSTGSTDVASDVLGDVAETTEDGGGSEEVAPSGDANDSDGGPSLDAVPWPNLDVPSDGTPDAEDPKEDLDALREAFFALDSAHGVEITLSLGAVMALEEEPYEYVIGDVNVDGEDFLQVGVRLKGKWGSFRTLDEKAAFLVNFAKYDKDSRLVGMKKIALNNLVQDASGMHEWLSYALLRSADLPASRVAYTWVRVNGEDYGFYAAIEVVDNPHFLSQFFTDNDGQLYEGEYGTDLFVEKIKDFDHDGGVEDGKVALYELAAALDAIEEDPEGGLAKLGEVIDVDRYLAFAATEIWLGHWDGYAWTRNNYFIYRPEEDEPRWTWIPWGLDQTFHDHLEPFGGDGRVTLLCNQDPDCRAQLGQHFLDVSARSADLDLLAQTYDIEAQTWGAMVADPRREHDTGSMGWEIDRTREFLAERPQTIEEGLVCLDPEAVDADGDGVSGCEDDCHDEDPNIYPGAPELCNLRDDDCDGEIDEGGDCPTCVPEIIGDVEYLFCFNALEWPDARQDCLEQGGDLASVHDEGTNEELFWAAIEIAGSSWWFGLSDLEDEGEFVWTDGSPFDFEDWADGEPNNSGEEDCGHWADWNDGRWNDMPCDYHLPYVCQF